MSGATLGNHEKGNKCHEETDNNQYNDNIFKGEGHKGKRFLSWTSRKVEIVLIY